MKQIKLLWLVSVTAGLMLFSTFATAVPGGPPGDGIYSVSLRTHANQSKIYANGNMQLGLDVFYELEDGESLNKIELLKFPTLQPISQLGINIDTSPNEYLKQIGSAPRLLASTQVETNQQRYLRTDNISKVEVCVKVTTKSGKSKDSCNLSIANGVIVLDAVRPVLYDMDDYQISGSYEGWRGQDIHFLSIAKRSQNMPDIIMIDHPVIKRDMYHPGDQYAVGNIHFNTNHWSQLKGFLVGPNISQITLWESRNNYDIRDTITTRAFTRLDESYKSRYQFGLLLNYTHKQNNTYTTELVDGHLCATVWSAPRRTWVCSYNNWGNSASFRNMNHLAPLALGGRGSPTRQMTEVDMYDEYGTRQAFTFLFDRDISSGVWGLPAIEIYM
ncbi:hypothetical protein [Photobacterium minamisatsumaniensis]|uniref:hypothetical protein n=1 Tax=Photobacterium minamisatsumaniensis TaxID=2910233 RepID=UPI003D10C416